MELKNLKDKAAELLKRLRHLSKKTLRLVVEYSTALALIVVMSLCALKLPEMHNKYLHTAVGKKVYMIRDSERSGGGTGFAVNAPSGQNYILTNDHVCEVSKDGVTVLVTSDEGSMRRRIVSHDENSDLCLIEGMPGVEGLSVAGSSPSLGDIMTVVGHPRLMPTHASSGELTGSEDVSILMAPISFIHPMTGQEVFIGPEEGGMAPGQCQLNKHSQELVDVDLMFFVIKVKFCVMTVKDAYITSIIIHPGNSGSPMVNFWGNVEGVAFASDGTNWGRIVPLQDIKAFLKNY